MQTAKQYRKACGNLCEGAAKASFHSLNCDLDRSHRKSEFSQSLGMQRLCAYCHGMFEFQLHACKS